MGQGDKMATLFPILTFMALAVTADGCSPGWTLIDGFCYKVFTETKTFKDSQKHCEIHYGYLAEVTSPAMNTQVYALLQRNSPGHPHAYIGVMKLSSGAISLAKHSFGSEVSYDNFDQGEPNYPDPSCVWYWPSHGKWDDIPCDSKKTFVCQRPNSGCYDPGAPNRVRIGSAVSHGSTAHFKCQPGYHILSDGNVRCNSNNTWSAPLPLCTAFQPCKDGWAIFGQFCFKVFHGGRKVFHRGRNFKDAAKYCKSHGSYLAEVTNKAMDNYVFSLVKAVVYWNPHAFIGISYHGIHEPKTFRLHRFDTPLYYTNWASGQPTLGSHTFDGYCVRYNNNGQWDDFSCFYHKAPFVCQRPACLLKNGYLISNKTVECEKGYVWQPTPGNKVFCDANGMLMGLGKCQLNSFICTSSWKYELFRPSGGSRMPFHNAQQQCKSENGVLLPMNLRRCGKQTLLAGFFDRGALWVGHLDTATTAYLYDKQASDRVVLYTVNTATPMPFLCAREKHCSPGWTLIERSCFKVFTEKKTFYFAQQHCHTMNGFLAEIISEPMNKQVYALLQHVIPEDPYAYIGVWKWENGDDFYLHKHSTVVSYDDWGPGEPNARTRSDHCVWYYQGKWDDTTCWHERKFICQKNFIPDWYAGCPPGWTYIDDFCFKVYTEKKTFANAQSHCKGSEGYLAEITGESLNTKVYALLKRASPNHPHAFIGVRKLSSDVDGVFSLATDSTGSEVSYDDFAPPEPNYHYPACVWYYPSNGKWDDTSCWHEKQFICQRPLVAVPAQGA